MGDRVDEWEGWRIERRLEIMSERKEVLIRGTRITRYVNDNLLFSH
jgi:hypothetical protein